MFLVTFAVSLFAFMIAAAGAALVLTLIPVRQPRDQSVGSRHAPAFGATS